MSSIGGVLHTSQMPGTLPNARQRAFMDLKYGLFLHFGINTFHDVEWSDGTFPASSYAPTALNCAQWVATARDAGMRYITLTTKHHDGFTLWNSADTTYGIGAPGAGNSTDVVAALAHAISVDNSSHEDQIKLCLYYSLWDRTRNADLDNTSLDTAYNQVMLSHLTELLTQYGPISMLWFDGATFKAGPRWGISDIYALMRRKQPHCVMNVNHSIGDGNGTAPPPNYPPGDIRIFDQVAGDPLKWMADVRSDDPALPRTDGAGDPKTFVRNGATYFLPFEGTFPVATNSWFWHASNASNFESNASLVSKFQTCISQQANVVFDVGPDPTGVIDADHVSKLTSLATDLRALSLIP